MRISVDVDEDTLAEVMEITGESGKGPALSKAIVEFVKRRKAAEFGRLIREGAFDYGSGEPDESEDATNPIPPLD
ncbi:MAG: type II toxin-antitoxin system VapB family antitoxin [Verrucomicrobiota bacterium]